MQQRGERHVGRMAGVSERGVDHVEKMAGVLLAVGKNLVKQEP